jgi:hypothetical protein
VWNFDARTLSVSRKGKKINKIQPTLTFKGKIYMNSILAFVLLSSASLSNVENYCAEKLRNT